MIESFLYSFREFLSRPRQSRYVEAFSKRDARLRAEWNGRNLKELIKRCGVSRSTVYRLMGK